MQGKRFVLPMPEKKASPSEIVPAKEEVSVDGSLLLEKEPSFGKKKKVSAKSKKKNLPLKEEVSVDRSLPSEKESCARKEKKLSADSEKKFVPVKEEVSVDRSLPLEKESPYARKEKKVSGDSEKEKPVTREKNMFPNTKETVFPSSEKINSPCTKETKTAFPIDTMPSKVAIDLKAVFRLLSTISPNHTLNTKIRRLRTWRENFDELQDTEKHTCSLYLERLKDPIIRMIFTDVANLEKKKRKEFFRANRRFLHCFFNKDIFETLYPIKKHTSTYITRHGIRYQVIGFTNTIK